ncbi:hypothetical protein [uncultured Kiloniella sp.]|uniref:hypothetical protein n=1 Tax=uncultured Kiloniella sp. TaxID=1133091 RepID=UPI00261B78B9|nr:hypothetical protein [uncultured Kiloniella sp.]
MSLETGIRDALLRVATEINLIRTERGSLASLTTTDKASIVAALNEVKTIAISAASTGGADVNDLATNTSDVWSSSKVNSEITNAVSAAVTGLVNGADGAMDTLKELSDAITSNDGDLSGILTSLSERVRTDTASQGLSDLQKTNARTNISAVSAADVGNTSRNFVSDFEGGLT